MAPFLRVNERRILPGMPGPGLEADEAMTIQQRVDPVERESLAELTVQDSLNLRPSERRDAALWRGAGLARGTRQAALEAGAACGWSVAWSRLIVRRMTQVGRPCTSR